jgi:hypothetical protein
MITAAIGLWIFLLFVLVALAVVGRIYRPAFWTAVQKNGTSLG